MFGVKSRTLSIGEKIMAISKDTLDQLIGTATTQEDLFGKDGLLKQLSKQIIERMLESELTNELGYEKNSKSKGADNARNGKTSKTVKTGNGEIQIDVPRDRKSEFEPALIPKRETRLTGAIC
jgi:putative transposase